jgi:hypothetical protein
VLKGPQIGRRRIDLAPCSMATNLAPANYQCYQADRDRVVREDAVLTHVLLQGLAGGVSFCLSAVGATTQGGSAPFFIALMVVLILQAATVFVLMGGITALRGSAWPAVSKCIVAAVVVAVAGLGVAILLARQLIWNVGFDDAVIFVALSLLIAIGELVIARRRFPLRAKESQR